VDELVKTQILEHDPQQHAQRIGQISDLMRQVHNLREEERLKESVARLEELGGVTSKAGELYEKALVYQALLAHRSLRDDEKAAEKARLLIDEFSGARSKQQSLSRN
jgi:hypothetical protein